MTKHLQVCIIALVCLVQNSFSNNQNLYSVVEAPSAIKRVRIDFVTPLGFTRHLLLAFTENNAASDAVDYGYDASNIENLPDDLNWLIEDGRYVIQGVGAFAESKIYPLGMFLSNDGQVKIKLDELENFDSEIDVFIFDKQEDTYTQINKFDFDADMQAGDYTERFYITFSNPDAKAAEETTLSDTSRSFNAFSVHYNAYSRSLTIDNPTQLTNIDVSLFDLNGRTVISKTRLSEEKILVPVGQLSTQTYVLRIQSDNEIMNKKVVLY